MKCDICGKDFLLVTTNQFNSIVFGVLVEGGNAVIPKANATVCNECCNKIIKFIDSIETSDNGGIIL
jgi:hypothetical protein